MQTLSRQETVDHVRAAIENDRDMYEDVAAAVWCGAKDDPAKFGELCVEFALGHMGDVRAAFPWLALGYEHVCAALASMVEGW